MPDPYQYEPVVCVYLKAQPPPPPMQNHYEHGCGYSEEGRDCLNADGNDAVTESEELLVQGLSEALEQCDTFGECKFVHGECTPIRSAALPARRLPSTTRSSPPNVSPLLSTAQTFRAT